MSGCLKEKKGYYYIVINYKDNTGKYKQKWIATGLVVANNKRKAEQLLRDKLHDFEENQNSLISVDSMSIQALIEAWLAVRKTVVKANTYDCYRITAESQVIPYFNELGVPVQELKAVQIQKYFTDKATQGLHSSTLVKHNTILHGALEYAVRTLEIIKVNPSECITLPRNQKRLPTFYTGEDLKKLFRVAEGCPIESAIRLSATFGLRRSEVLGLQWGAVSFKEKTIVIQHTVVRYGTKTIADDLVKSQSSFRTMPLTNDVETYLKKLYAHQKQMKALCGKDYNNNDYICKWDDGKLFDPNYVTRKFRKLLAEKDLPPIRFHDLRHSSASLLINNGFSLKEVQEWLGHADIASTNIYSHLLYKSKQDMADKINKILSVEANLA